MNIRRQNRHVQTKEVPWISMIFQVEYFIHRKSVHLEIRHSFTSCPHIQTYALQTSYTGYNACNLQRQVPLKANRLHPSGYSTHRPIPWTDNDSSLLFAVLGKAEPLTSTGQTDGPMDRRMLPTLSEKNYETLCFYKAT